MYELFILFEKKWHFLIIFAKKWLLGGLIFVSMKTKKLERNFQAKLVKEIKNRFPGSIVIKSDPDYLQGIPDLLILHNKNWASLECKRSKKAPRRPNQDYYVERMNEMSFSRYIYPENKEEVLNELEQAFKV